MLLTGEQQVGQTDWLRDGDDIWTTVRRCNPGAVGRPRHPRVLWQASRVPAYRLGQIVSTKQKPRVSVLQSSVCPSCDTVHCGEMMHSTSEVSELGNSKYPSRHTILQLPSPYTNPVLWTPHLLNCRCWCHLKAYCEQANCQNFHFWNSHHQHAALLFQTMPYDRLLSSGWFSWPHNASPLLLVEASLRVICFKLDQDEIWQERSWSKHTPIDGAGLSIWHHTFKMAAITSFRTEKCYDLVSACSDTKCLSTTHAAASGSSSLIHSKSAVLVCTSGSHKCLGFSVWRLQYNALV